MLITKPDIFFIEEINKDTKNSLKSCMQCGTCSVVCDLAPEKKPFPRKEMFWASWGLKEKLMRDPDVWLCHQCGDCTSNCPRGVKPGDVLASIRRISYNHYARPKFLAAILSKPAFLPVVFALPVIFLFIVLSVAGTLQIHGDEINFASFLPHRYLNISFSVMLIFVLLAIITSARIFWKNIEPHKKTGANNKTLIKVTTEAIGEILLHENFKKCTNQKFRYPAHFLIFWGFILLIITTILAIINVLFFEYPLGVWHPVKILGNISGIIFLAGCGLFILQRLRKSRENQIYNYADWVFLVTLIMVGFTGFLTEGARFHNWDSAYKIYFIHLVFNWILIIYLPFTKFSHIIYRLLATIKSRYYGR